MTRELINNERVIKQGICTDVDSTLTGYGRSITSPRYLFVLRACGGLDEEVMKTHFKKFHLKLNHRIGEFYRECDEWYECCDLFLQRWSTNLTPELRKYLSFEIEGREIV